MNKSKAMQFVNPIHTFDHFTTMNRDNTLPFPEQIPDASYSNSKTINNKVTTNRSSSASLQQQTPRSPLTAASYQPSGQDIICGRGRGSFLHEGNKAYLSLLRRNIHAYLHAKKRVDKSAIIDTLVLSLKERGFRFLKQDDKNQRWYELSEQECYDRTAHAIRDLIRKQKGRNKKPLSQYASRSRSPSQSDSDISVISHKKGDHTIISTSVGTPLPLNSMSMYQEQSNTNQFSSSSILRPNSASLPRATVNITELPTSDADSFDENISAIPFEAMRPTDRLNTVGFGAFFELEPDDFEQVLSQLDTEKREDRASWESK
ncbi:unnamed protein product [Cylindrotheca closterium]|uniref:DUF6824 domain-containing protein n=1 Tax=Cylindrotheca closterium TaxID=2856 RepID=A0AAD2CPT5_9STRA|nr:unnamed protein product [Cylindrotheca closterium]